MQNSSTANVAFVRPSVLKKKGADVYDQEMCSFDSQCKRNWSDAKERVKRLQERRVILPNGK